MQALYSKHPILEFSMAFTASPRVKQINMGFVAQMDAGSNGTATFRAMRMDVWHCVCFTTPFLGLEV
jgi:hypothetical protein